MADKFNPLVSILIPVYNGSNFLNSAIESAIAQTYLNVEIIIIDDGSTDKTKEVAGRYKNNKNISYHYKKNGGVSTALNYGIEKAKGEYIAWLSHDDVFLPDKIEKQINLLEDCSSINRQETVQYSAFSEMNEDNIIYDKFEPHKKFPAERLMGAYFPVLLGLVYGCTTLIPIKCFKEIGMYKTELKYVQDVDMWFRLFAKYKIKYLPDVTAIYRKHKAQGTNDTNPQKDFENNNLYKNMVNGMSVDQMIECSGSELKFYKEILAFVYELRYMDAAIYLEERIEKYIFANSKRLKFREITKKLLKKILMILPHYRRLNEIEERQEHINKKVDSIIKLIDKNN